MYDSKYVNLPHNFLYILEMSKIVPIKKMFGYSINICFSFSHNGKIKLLEFVTTKTTDSFTA